MPLNANPTDTLHEAVTETDVIETVNESTIEALADAARRLDNTSSTLADRASDHTAAQAVYETRAASSAAGAENAATEAGYHADMSNLERSEVAADRHNILGHSAEARAQDAGAKANALDEVARVQIAVQEVTERTAIAETEVENRTAAGVEAEMKALGAVEEANDKVAQDLEAQLAANADPSLATPRA